MESLFSRCFLTAACGLSLASGSLLAQGSPVQNASGVGQAGARAAAQPGAPGQPGLKQKLEEELGSEILLLQKTDHFYTSLSVGYEYNTNVFYDFTELDDWSLESDFELGARTVLGGSFYLDVAYQQSRSDYQDYDALSRNVIGGRATVGGLLGPVPFGLTYTGEWYFDEDFDSDDLSFHILSASFPIWGRTLGNRTSVSVMPYFNWVMADPDDFDQLIPGLSLGVNVKITDKTSLNLTVLESYSYYQHYLPQIFREDREDWATTVALGVTHRFTKNLELRVEARYSNNTSTLEAYNLSEGRFVDLYDYDSWIFTPTVALKFTF